MIEIKRIADRDPLEFEVTIAEKDGESRHRVTMTKKAFEKLAAGRYSPEQCLEAAVRFLLDREHRDSILGRFDVSVISRYFPDFERELPHYLTRL